MGISGGGVNKTIYIKPEDANLWDRARELSHGKLSAVLMEALREYVLKKEKEACPTCGVSK